MATYNIHKARGMDGRVRIERIARVLGTGHIGSEDRGRRIQRVDGRTPRTGSAARQAGSAAEGPITAAWQSAGSRPRWAKQ
jgi:endonuclease/exonuclease/phosphatase family metal-dependent hydrolase